MALSETLICNAALAKIGAKRLNDLDADDSVEAVHCKTHYEMTRDSLLRSHYWRCAMARADLSQDTVDPDFEWDAQFILPDDFLRMRSIYDANNTPGNKYRKGYALEGKRLLINETSCKIRYIRKVTDVTDFDPLFVEVLVLRLALKLIGPLADGDAKLQETVQRELAVLMRQVRVLDRQETNTGGRAEQFTWVDVRATRGGRIDSRLGSA